MNIPQIQIRQQFAKIDINTTPGMLQIRQHKADMQIRQHKGILEIEQSPVKVNIDSYPSRYDRGIKNNADFARDNFNRARAITLEAIAAIANEGDRLMRIEYKGNPIAEIGLEKSTPKPVELTLGWVRKPSFEMVPPRLRIHYVSRKPEISVKLHRPETAFTRGKVEISIRQYGDVEISVKGSSVDQQL